jgi:hypothetical protein
MADERTEFGFKRIVCDCSACSKFCFAIPGYLVPSDIQRMAERLNEPDITQFAFDNLLASPGAIVIANGAYRTIPTLVPARKPDGSLRWSCFDGQQCCIENKRHDHEKRTIKIQSRLGKASSSQTQIRRRIQTASVSYGPERSGAAFSGPGAWDQREPDPSMEARVSDRTASN